MDSVDTVDDRNGVDLADREQPAQRPDRPPPPQSPPAPLRVLILEDNGADMELMKRELRRGGFDSRVQWAQDQGTFLAALEAATPDLILADYSLPGFDGLTALALVRQRWADVPVVIVSGAIGEEVAIETLKAGATDYVLKQRLSRLGPVVGRALAEARARAEKRQAEEALREAHEQLQEHAARLQVQARELHAQTEALQELTATLESKVAQRTAELEHRARQLQKLTLDLSEAEDRERRRLAEILHDDLQQQLAAAKFHLALLNNRAKHNPGLQAIIAQVDHLLQDAVERSRSLSHELSPAALHQNDVGEILRWLGAQVQSRHGLRVAVEVFGDVRTPSDAIKTFLYKTAQELLFNVVKHARVNGARLRVRRLGRYLCLSVSDHGRGFDPQELPQAAGFGLLSIRERIELLGGRMKIKSAKGRGSTFRIAVPDAGPQDDAPEKKTAGAELPAGPTPGAPGESPLRVLLADDHDIVREGLASLLGEEYDIEVVGEAANGREVVDQAYRLRPDVVIMDVVMPLITGDSATRQIKQHLPGTRVIVLSLYDKPETKETMYRAGADGYVLKTAPSEELLAAIRGREPRGGESR